MLRRTAVVGALMLSTSTLACKLTGLEHPLVFPPGESALPTTEILKLAEWDSQLKEDFRGGGKYRVRLREEAEPAADPELASLRLRSIQAVLDAVGIEATKWRRPKPIRICVPWNARVPSPKCRQPSMWSSNRTVRTRVVLAPCLPLR